MEKYRSGYNGPHSKCGSHESGSWVRIPPSPPLNKKYFNILLKYFLFNSIILIVVVMFKKQLNIVIFS